MAHRFFLSPGAIAGDEVTFDPAMIHQLRNVLRLRPGAKVIVLDDSGLEYEVTLTTLERDTAIGRVRARQMAQTEPRVSLTLYQSTIKGDRFEWVLQKGTELGVSRFVPMSTERAIVRDPKRLEGKRARWERIIRKAAEQSRRGRLPRLSPPAAYAEACRESTETHDLVLLPWVQAPEVGLAAALRAFPSPVNSIALMVGPEGGFAAKEAALAQECGIRLVTLGPRILRAETAGVVASAIVLSELGEMG
jgi:16S rRNA (uracil1498-N3)-methyltransferase